ncbi:hypothetical protein AB4059_00785 [Lysobacter sp. 2RAF19]
MQRWRTLDAWILATLVVAAVVLAGLSVARFRSLTRVVPFAGQVVDGVPATALLGRVERCAVSPRRFEVSGWMAQPGVARGPHVTRVLLRDDRDGRLWQLPTELPPRSDVNVQLNRAGFAGADYTTSGYAASLDLRRAKPRIAAGQVFIAYDQGTSGRRYQLVRVACRMDGA